MTPHKRKKKNKVIFYSDELKDDFAETSIKTDVVDENYKFTRKSKLWKIVSDFFYYIVAVPIVWTVSKLYLGVKFENRKAFKKLKNQGCFIYTNHTRALDVFIPPLAALPKRTYTVANADAVSIKGIRWLVMMLGCLPIPTQKSGMKKFMTAVEQRCMENAAISIFPEAHIWPFYTGIRDFPTVSFRYPAKTNSPVVAMCVTYRKRKGLFRFCKKPGMTVHISEPIYAEKGMSEIQTKKYLYDKVYDFMVKTSQNCENIEYIHYEKTPEK